MKSVLGQCALLPGHQYAATANRGVNNDWGVIMRTLGISFALPVLGLAMLLAVVPRPALSQNDGRASPPNYAPTIQELKGFGFGAGVAVTFDINRTNRVGNASVDANNIVRVTESSDVIAGFVLESHYFFPLFDNKKEYPFFDNKTAWLGHGPFVALEMGSTAADGKGIINAYGLGWMVGLRRWTNAVKTDAVNKETKVQYTYTDVSWNFGVGLRVDPNAKTLGDGIVANQLLPAGETTPVRTKTGPRYGLMLVSSFSF